MGFTYRSNLDKLWQKLDGFKRLPQQGRNWVEESAEELDGNVREHLRTQGRGGHPPPLSQATLKMYKVDGKPNGSGIRDHLTPFHQHSANQSISGIGIPLGKPTIVARVQNFGATIRVTEKMRGYLSARGIFLRDSTQAIRIPGRKFWSKSWEKTRRSRLRALQQILKP